VDDDEEVRKTLAAMLDTAGYAVASYDGALQALEELKSRRQVDLMVIDFAIPELRGRDFVAEVRRLRGAVPVIFVTGNAEPTALQAESWVLQKPFKATSLIRMVEQATSDADALTSRV
jgi:CheY-like chemotaxis protein